MKKQQSVTLYIIAVFLFLLVAISLFMLWNSMTSRASGMIECKINQIDYVYLTDDNGSGSCALPAMISGNLTACALPKDFYCKGLLQDFPIVKTILEAGNG